MKVYSYVVASDSGFAPRPFGRYCTLACCKPAIRRSAAPGDWIVGLTSRSRGIVYAMRVTEKLDFASYWADGRFRRRRPDLAGARIRDRSGDNIYEPRPDGGFHQLPSGHSFADGRENPAMKGRDLGGRYVLVSDDFVYFGSRAPDLPADLAFLRVGRGHRCRFPDAQVRRAVEFLRTLPRGVLGRPARWPERDASWKAC